MRGTNPTTTERKAAALLLGLPSSKGAADVPRCAAPQRSTGRGLRSLLPSSARLGASSPTSTALPDLHLDLQVDSRAPRRAPSRRVYDLQANSAASGYRGAAAALMPPPPCFAAVPRCTLLDTPKAKPTGRAYPVPQREICGTLSSAFGGDRAGQSCPVSLVIWPTSSQYLPAGEPGQVTPKGHKPADSSAAFLDWKRSGPHEKNTWSYREATRTTHHTGAGRGNLSDRWWPVAPTFSTPETQKGVQQGQGMPSDLSSQGVGPLSDLEHRRDRGQRGDVAGPGRRYAREGVALGRCARGGRLEVQP